MEALEPRRSRHLAPSLEAPMPLFSKSSRAFGIDAGPDEFVPKFLRGKAQGVASRHAELRPGLRSFYGSVPIRAVRRRFFA